MMKNKCGSRKESLVFLFFCLGTIVLRVFYISKVTGPFVYADEFGYWAHAAHLVGKTWAGVMDGMTWYGFGYSFLLAPVLLLSSKMVVIYKMAVLFNVAMCVGVYGVAYLIAGRLFVNWDVLQRGTAAFAATSFSSYIFYSYVTMSETCVTLLLWLVFYELILAEESPKWWKGLLIGITLGFLYMVHNRTIGVIVVVFLCMLLLFVRHCFDLKTNASCLIALIFMIILKHIFESVFLDMIENNYMLNTLGITIKVGGATMAGSQVEKVVGLFHFQGMKELILNIIGQLWECMSATYLLFGMGFVYAARRFWYSYRAKQNMCLYFFPLLAVLTSIGITGIFFYLSPLVESAGKTRIDTLFYGRYNECFFGIFILLGIGLLAERRKDDYKIYLIILAVYIGLSAIMYVRLGNTDNTYLNVVSAIGIHVFHWLGEFSVWKCAIIAVLGAMAVTGLYHIGVPYALRHYAACLVLVFLFATTALYCMRISIRGENDYTMQYTPMYDYLNENTEKGEIVYITANGKPAFDLQSRLVDKPVVFMGGDSLESVKEKSFAVIRGEELEALPIINYEVCLECEDFLILELN